jgi:hypothetical protein
MAEQGGQGGGQRGLPPLETQTAIDQERLRERRRRVASEHEQRDDNPAGSVRDGSRNTPPGTTDSTPFKPRQLLIALGVAAAIAVAAITWQFSGTKSDDVSSNTKAQWAASFAVAAPTALKLVPSGEVDGAVKQMKLPPAQEQELKEEVSAGRTRMVWLSFRDVMAEDGDTVSIESMANGVIYRQSVVATNKEQRVYLPEPDAGRVNIRGVRDGGGGITIEITSGGAPLNLPFMTVGQVVSVQTFTSP